MIVAAQDPSTNDAALERQRRWDKAKADLMEKRMRESQAAIAAARKKDEQRQAEEAARAKAEQDKKAAEEAQILREKRRLEGIKREAIRKADEDAIKSEQMAQAVAEGLRSEYRRRVIKDWLQIAGEIVVGLIVVGFAATWIKRLAWPSKPKT